MEQTVLSESCLLELVGGMGRDTVYNDVVFKAELWDFEGLCVPKLSQINVRVLFATSLV